MTNHAYDIEADWILFSGCNYRCQYCFWSGEVLGARPVPPAEVDRLVDFFDRTEKRWLIHLTGGEPFLYPQFVELVQRLTQRHRVSVNSNLSTDRVDYFAETVDPERVSFMNCAVHVAERERHNRVEDFARKMKLLRAAGFKAFATYVFYPPLLERAAADFEAYAAMGVPLFPKAFRGAWEGQSYPAAYTPEDRDLFMRLSRDAELAYAEMWEGVETPPTIDPLLDRDLVLNGVKDYRGRLCSAGRDFVRIRENGDVQRCGPSEILGNIALGTLELKTEPTPCQDLECPYFCYKYLVPDRAADHVKAERPESILPAPSAGILGKVRALAGRLASRQ